MKVLKAVLPVAGLGTRMLPATKAIPKEMLPLVDKPLIQYVVNEAVAAGIKEIVLVTHASKNSIENHFDTSFELEATLEARVKRSLLEEVRSIVPKDVTVISVRQSAPLGLGHAVLAARPIVGENPFAVMLPDVIIDKYQSDAKKDNLSQMIDRFDKTGHNQVMVEAVPHEQVHQYGVVDLAGKKIKAGESAAIKNMVEKPNNDEAPSNLAITGRYVVSTAIWDLLEYTPPGAGGEIQLTDALLQLRHLETLEAYHLKGKSHDCGSKLGYMLANVEYAMQSSHLGKEFTEQIRKLI
ncbi:MULTISPECIES: UTP--glucose-1-phosphate uridylyltransferase GalU [Pseudoalteromonas]|uniref:UTP--glucose-1-phosphate uridylyltransferase n=1 Tax=Pseudoalteromonas carrageenovora IAM 12662 TaxID=1314868 RepID=A0A2K4XA44_PSEVC|nr:MULTISPECIES: UTP--glucose-1-phosphate uridylyltransferase GalU [Pseudoalteromonas]KTF10495.1 UTP--glucose-1-phosphate uridylyltransferase [Pseudoalteromonas sp. H103]MBE0381336.1 UTP--glucose-1-phosphate uridylyltransferase [Pseudoalteromonas carrageenovora IAM 12662]MCQ8887985.1 UTP--glucose-1-phosphate uridylyltransferase GalU [Pseudoalteromonas carrageenovora]MDO6463885.1 UTP--glucose-1-phosphate uridylyltransferase GalU [Pseudoalteromonas carrageenovora]MDO6546992.1 UTP--glucose-1-phos